MDARLGGLVALVRLDAAIVNGEFLEVGKDAERELGGPGVAAELEGGLGLVLDDDGRFFGFEKEFAGAADAKAVVRRFGGFADFDGVFVNDVFIGFGVTGVVIDIPAEGFEEGIKEFAAELGFVVVAGFVGIELLLETGNEIENLVVS